MGTFFKGWRRKLGIVALALACVATTGWVRSLLYQDGFWWQSHQSIQSILSVDGKVCWIGSRGVLDPSSVLFWPTSRAYSLATLLRVGPYTFHSCPWRWMFGFGTFDISTNGDLSMIGRAIPYWSIVVPLTLQSAWLLLSKPKQSPVTPSSPSPDIPVKLKNDVTRGI